MNKKEDVTTSYSALMAYKKKYGNRRRYKKRYTRGRKYTTRRRRYGKRTSTNKFCYRLAKKNVSSIRGRTLAPKSYSNSRVFNTFKIRALPFGPGDFDTTSVGSWERGHWVYDYTLIDMMDQNDLNEMKEYRNWILKSLIITYSIKDHNNMLKFTKVAQVAPAAQFDTLNWVFDRIGQQSVFKFKVGVFDNADLQTACANLITTFTGSNMGTIVQNKVQLENTRKYKDLTLNGNKAIFKWYNSSATSDNMPSMTSIPSLTSTLDSVWALGTPVGRTVHGADFNLFDANYYFNAAAADYKASFTVYQTMSAVIYCKNRNPVP